MTTSDLDAPDYQTALVQHQGYVRALEAAGLSVESLDPLPHYPDAHFVEDTAVVTPELAIIARSGAASRRGEEETVEPILARLRSTIRIVKPGFLDGGDVLIVGRHIFVGISRRTNRDGARQLGTALEEWGYTWEEVPVDVGLHLKSNVNWVRENTLVMTQGMARGEWGLGSGEWSLTAVVRRDPFTDFRRIVVDEDDEDAANVLSVNQRLLMPAGFPRVRTKLERLGMPIVELDLSEFRKMDGGMTCLSIRF